MQRIFQVNFAEHCRFNPLRTTWELGIVRFLTMGRRQRLIGTSILRAIFKSKLSGNPDKSLGILARILAFFSVFHLALSRYRAELFKKLRNEIWQIDEEEYTESFRSPSKGKRTDLIAVGDLGYSGSVRYWP